MQLLGTGTLDPGHNSDIRTGTAAIRVGFDATFSKAGADWTIVHGANLRARLFTSLHLAGHCWFDRGASGAASQQWYKGENHVSAEIHLEHLFNSISDDRDYVTINTNFILIRENIYCSEIVSAQHSCLRCCEAGLSATLQAPKTSEMKTITSPQHALNVQKSLTLLLFAWITGSYSPGVLSADYDVVQNQANSEVQEVTNDTDAETQNRKWGTRSSKGYKPGKYKLAGFRVVETAKNRRTHDHLAPAPFC